MTSIDSMVLCFTYIMFRVLKYCIRKRHPIEIISQKEYTSINYTLEVRNV